MCDNYSIKIMVQIIGSKALIYLAKATKNLIFEFYINEMLNRMP